MLDQNSSMAPGITYHPDLIPRLCADHQVLLQQLELVQQYIEENNYQAIAPQLELFRQTMLDHITEENLKLYIYLQQSLNKDPEKYQKLRQLRKELNASLQIVLEFLNMYTLIQEKPELQDTVASDFKQIRSLYIERINIEEQRLFPLYQP